MRVRSAADGDGPSVERLIDVELGGRVQVRLDESIDVLAADVLVAELEPASPIVGVVTVAAGAGDAAELAALAVEPAARGRGVGAALVQAAADHAWSDGATELWLVTTNDNLPALAVYQQCGFRLAELRQGAVDRARTVKPSIPLVGAHGIGLHDELVLRLSRPDRA